MIRLIIKNSIRPSSKASYNCEGCLGNISILPNTTLHGTLLSLPISSPLIKFAIRPKKIPIGETHAITSKKRRDEVAR